MKITCPTKDRHDIWVNVCCLFFPVTGFLTFCQALNYLLARPSGGSIGPGTPSNVFQTPGSVTDDDHSRQLTSPPGSHRVARTSTRGDTWNSTPRGKRSRSQLSIAGSVSKRSGTPALEYLRWNGPESPFSPDRSFADVGPPSGSRNGGGPDNDELDFELHEDENSDDGFEGLENVRACCDGRHTVGHLNKAHHHHHHQAPHLAPALSSSGRKSVDERHHHLDASALENRPASPAWSFRSKGSTQDHEGGSGLFTWGRSDGERKFRFGSKRLAKSTSTPGSVQD